MRFWKRYGLIAVLFVALRLMVLVTFPADNLTLYGDYVYYYELAAYSDQGYLPFVHYWSEYPPVFPFLSVGVYQLARLAGGGYHVYVGLMGLLMLSFSTGSLALFLRLAQKLRGDGDAERRGWVYSVLFVPIIFTWWTFDALTVFSLLLALELLLSGRERWSAAAMGVGVLIKLVPMLVFPAVVRTRPWRRWLLYGLIAAVVVAAVALPLLLIGGDVALTSFRSPAGRSSWQTVWALLDGNLCTGLLGAPADHFDLAMATAPSGNPARLPEGIRLLVFGLLWSKGWSPQWQTLLFPLVLLALPLRRGVLFILVLSFVNLAEWPVLLSRGLNQWLYLTVPLRTGLFVLLLVDLWGAVRR